MARQKLVSIPILGSNASYPARVSCPPQANPRFQLWRRPEPWPPRLRLLGHKSTLPFNSTGFQQIREPPDPQQFPGLQMLMTSLGLFLAQSMFDFQRSPTFSPAHIPSDDSSLSLSLALVNSNFLLLAAKFVCGYYEGVGHGTCSRGGWWATFPQCQHQLCPGLRLPTRQEFRAVFCIFFKFSSWGIFNGAHNISM